MQYFNRPGGVRRLRGFAGSVRAFAGALTLLGLAGAPVHALGQATPLLVLPFSFFDTSGEPRDQSAEHAARLAAMTGDLGSKLQDTGLFRLVPLAGQVTGCERGDSDCLLSGARQAGAALVLAGAVQKISTMASDVWIGAFDAASGKRVFYRQLTFRGDTDDSWQRATIFLLHQIEADPPKVP